MLPSAFRNSIDQAQRDSSLQAALDANAERRIAVRASALATLPDFANRRQKARAVRAAVIDNLDAHLANFISQAEANGLIVHRAADAAEAVRIAVEIARQNGARLVAKSKSMVSEEIELNHALEEAGLRVVETDLGEYIVQLRGERPSHIITPAVHLRRGDVGRTFQEKLGVEYTEDIPTMTELARNTLRQVFLEADIGISGVNFAVIENGMLCTITNEGNGRMVTSIPDIHIALLGIERLVPTMDDLALMLSLLPRSATGQKMTVYASLVNSPRKSGENEGPRQRHVILVDNGRRSIANGPLAESLYCIRCGACLNACPVFRELGGHAYVSIHGVAAPYPGPIGSVISPALFGQAEFGHLARASSLCGACKDACPVDIDLPSLLLRTRAGGAEPSTPPNTPKTLKVGLRFYTWLASSPARFRMAQKLAAIGAWVFALLNASPPGWLRLPKATGWGYSKAFPRPASRTFLQQYSGQQAPAQVPTAPPISKPVSTPRRYQEKGPLRVDLVEQFCAELDALRGEVFKVTPSGLDFAILSFMRHEQLDEMTTWDAPNLQLNPLLPADLLDKLRARGIKIHPSPDPQVRVGLTGALAGAADTGTLLIPGGPGQPLSASLLPEIHLAVLPVSALQPGMAEMFAVHGSAIHEIGAAAALVTGPSRTADIEMTLTLGVHGPKRVVVFLVMDGEPSR